VQPIRSFIPELKRAWAHPHNPPICRARWRTPRRVSEMMVQGAHLLEIGDRLSLARDDGLELMGEIALRPELQGELPLAEHGLTHHVHLAA